jgi:hypothetical protein
LCFEDGEVTDARGFGWIVEDFDEQSADSLADVCENGFAVGLLAVGEAESHTDAGSLAFADIENEHAALLIDADDAGLLERAGPDIGARLLAQTENRVKLS